MQSPILFASIGSDLGQMAHDTAVRFGVDLPHFAAQCISFLIVAFLLQRYAYKPILTMLEERKKRIKEGLDNAEKIKQELANTQTRTHEIMVQAGQQAAKMIDFAGMRAVHYVPGTKEEQSLEERMVKNMKQRSGKTGSGYRRRADTQPHDPDAETQSDNPYVLDAVIGEQAFEIVLREREQHAQDSRGESDRA